MTIRDLWDAGNPHLPAGFQTWGEAVSNGVDAVGGVAFAHDWDQDGWAPFTTVVMTQDGSQDFAETVVTGRGVVTGTQPGDGNHREANIWNVTDGWTDSEMTSLIWGPSEWQSGGAQQGHIHRVRERAPGEWEGIAVWTAVFGGDYATLNYRGVRWDGATLPQSGGNPATSFDSRWIDRTGRVHAAERNGFLIQNYLVVRPELSATWEVGDTVVITASNPDASFNVTGAPIQSVTDFGLGVAQPGGGGPVVTLQPMFATIRPGGVDIEKRWTPFWLSTRVIGGSTSSAIIQAKRWRPDEPEPDWGDPRVLWRTIISDIDVPDLAVGPGALALWNAHYHDGISGMWGPIYGRSLD